MTQDDYRNKLESTIIAQKAFMKSEEVSKMLREDAFKLCSQDAQDHLQIVWDLVDNMIGEAYSKGFTDGYTALFGKVSRTFKQIVKGEIE